MKKTVWMMMVMLMLSATALGDCVKLENVDVSDHEAYGFGMPIGFTAGCYTDESGWADFLLVDTFDFNGHYLLWHADETGDWISISGGLPIEDGSLVEVSAEDAKHCAVTTAKDGVTQRYSFAYAATPDRPQQWVLEAYERTDGKGNAFSAHFSRWLADMTETKDGKTQQAIAFYEFFHEANNLTHSKLPKSIEEAKAFEEQYPVAVVSPKDPSSRVNLRRGPSKSSERYGSLYSGAMLEVMEVTKDGWAKIRLSDQTAYINTDFLTFGEGIAHVQDGCKTATLRDADWIEVSRAPYRGGGGTVTQMAGGQDVRVVGEYNDQWRIVDAGYNLFFVSADALREGSGAEKSSAQPTATQVPTVPLAVLAQDDNLTAVYGGSDQDALYDIAVSSDGRIAMTGFTQSTDGTLVNRTKTGRSGWALCVDDRGEVLWSFVTRQGSSDTLRAPVFHPDGSVTMMLEALTGDGTIMELIRLDTAGNVVMRKTLQSGGSALLIRAHNDAGYILMADMGYTLYGYDGAQIKTVSFEKWYHAGSPMIASGRHIIRIRPEEAGVLYAVEDMGTETELCELFPLYYSKAVGTESLLGARYDGLISLEDGGAAGCGWVLDGTDESAARCGRIARWDARGNTVFDMWMASGLLKDIVKTGDGFACLSYPQETEENRFASELPWSLVFFDEQGVMRRTVDLGLCARDDCAMTQLEDGRIAVLQRVTEDGETPKSDARLLIIDDK